MASPGGRRGLKNFPKINIPHMKLGFEEYNRKMPFLLSISANHEVHEYCNGFSIQFLMDYNTLRLPLQLSSCPFNRKRWKLFLNQITFHSTTISNKWIDIFGQKNWFTNDLSLNSNFVNDLIQQFLQGNGPLRHPSLNEESK